VIEPTGTWPLRKNGGGMGKMKVIFFALVIVGDRGQAYRNLPRCPQRHFGTIATGYGRNQLHAVPAAGGQTQTPVPLPNKFVLFISSY